MGNKIRFGRSVMTGVVRFKSMSVDVNADVGCGVRINWGTSGVFGWKKLLIRHSSLTLC